MLTSFGGLVSFHILLGSKLYGKEKYILLKAERKYIIEDVERHRN